MSIPGLPDTSWPGVDQAALSPLLAPGPGLLAAAMARAAAEVSANPLAVARHLAAGLRQTLELLQQEQHDAVRLRQFARSWLDQLPQAVGLDDRSAARARVGIDVLCEALRPSNVVLTNPVALRRARVTIGRSLLAGARTALTDIAMHGGLPALADRDAFRVGRDLAATPGVVVHRTTMFELNRYTPTSSAGYEVPVLFVPSQVNKYYIVDLAPGQSLVEHLRDAGLQMFAMSWRNPCRSERWTLSNYVRSVSDAVGEVRRVTGADRVHLVGMCAGAISAVLSAAGHDGADSIATFSSIVGMLDTRDRSPLGAFVTPRAARAAAARSHRRGVVPAADLGRMFALARSRELFWTPWQRNYLCGETPPANAVLYWSQDAVNLASGLHADLLGLLVDNKLARPGGVMVDGRPIDLRDLSCDAFFLAGAGDHLVPAGAVLRSARLLAGNVEFVVAEGGHIRCLLAGNPRRNPLPHRRALLTAGDGRDEPPMLETAPGGWWNHWTDWLIRRSGSRCPVVSVSIEAASDAAPGRYVTEIR